MPAPDELERVLTDIHHSGTTLALHLVNTWKILQGWNCPEPVCVAGLLHSAYGVLLPPNDRSRERLRSKVGTDAENIIFHVHTIPADLVHCRAGGDMPMTVRGIDGKEHCIDAPLARGIVTVDVASTLEQCLRFDMEPAQMDRRRAVFTRSLAFLPDAAQDVVARVWNIERS